MSEYILILVWLASAAFLARYLGVYKTKLNYGIEETRCNWTFALIVFVPIIIMAGNRSLFLGDTLAYKINFEEMPTLFNDLKSYVSELKKDRGFYVISSLIKILITKNVRTYFLIIAGIQALLLIGFFRKYSESYITSVFLFVASADYFSWMYNGIRQFLAVVIILLVVPFLLKKQYFIPILIIVLASTIHQSALLMLPIIFIAAGDAWNKKTISFLALSLIAIVFIDGFTDFLDSSLETTQYSSVVEDYQSWEDDGTNYLRVMVYSVPAILSLFCKKKINRSDNAVIKLSANMSIVSAGLYIVSMFTSGIFLGRLPIYCSLFGYILIPWIAKECFSKKGKTIFYFLMVSLYLIYYYFQMHVTWQLF